ncbi:hypothetical protein WA026_019339 [Henosepilachna vigintioctopunctata]|uniref:Uncharacterized protein n=1 Tax=Henosepilachna vigintioctopunctata TaxID=420089 RepID=A0AAW1UAN8_9CUCU
MDIEEPNIGNLQSLINNYEYLIQDLTREIETFQIEYRDLNSKIRNVVDENDKLSKHITYLINKNNQDKDIPSQNEPIKVENLKKQLNLIATEKDYTVQLWQNALKTIDHLEGELRIYQSNRKDYISKEEVMKMKKECSIKIKELEDELMLTKTSLLKNTRHDEKYKQADLLLKNDSHTKIIRNLEDEILALQERLKQSNKAKEELSKIINKQNKKAQSLDQKNKEYVEKVNEAMQVVEAACIEKDYALMREKEAKDEIKKVSKSLLEVIEQAEIKIKSEVDQVKSDFNSNLKNVLEDLKKAHDDSMVKQNEIDIYAKQCALLENEIKRLQNKRSHSEGDSDRSSKLLTLEKNLERTFQKLLTSEKENIILNAEISRLKSDINDMIRHFETDIKAREIEKISLQNKVSHMKNQLNEMNEKYLDSLKLQEDMRTKLLEEKETFKKEMDQKQIEFQISHSKKTEVVNTKYERNIKEMEDQFLAQMEVHQKWRTETKIIVAKLEGQIRYQKELLRKLNQVNWHLKKKLKGKNKEKKNITQGKLSMLRDPLQIETKMKDRTMYE